MAKAMFDEYRNSRMAWVSTVGRPWPPNSAGAEAPTQPPATSFL